MKAEEARKIALDAVEIKNKKKEEKISQYVKNILTKKIPQKAEDGDFLFTFSIYNEEDDWYNICYETYETIKYHIFNRKEVRVICDKIRENGFKVDIQEEIESVGGKRGDFWYIEVSWE